MNCANLPCRPMSDRALCKNAFVHQPGFCSWLGNGRSLFFFVNVFDTMAIFYEKDKVFVPIFARSSLCLLQGGWELSVYIA